MNLKSHGDSLFGIDPDGTTIIYSFWNLGFSMIASAFSLA